MANLDSSWEASVVKLAQAGNLRALTFWLNRYLVPQGLCAQVSSDARGLMILVVCHRLPDGDRLVHFLRQRFLELNSEVIDHLQITAQRVGSPEVMWKRSVALRFSSQPQNLPQVAESAAVIPSSASGDQQAERSGDRVPMSIQFVPRPIPRSQPVSQTQVSGSQVAGNQVSGSQPIARKRLKKRLSNRRVVSSNRGFSKIQGRMQTWKEAALDRADDLKSMTARTVYRSQRWFGQRSPEVKSLLIGSSVASIVAVGCGLQVLSQYMSLPSGELWQAAMTDAKPIQSGKVQTSLEQLPIIRQTVQNPQDAAVTLVFADNAALAQGSNVAAYQQADLLMSNLDNALIAPPGSTSSISPGTSSSGTSSPETASSLAPSPGVSSASLMAASKITAAKTIAPTEPLTSEIAQGSSAQGSSAQDSAAALDSAAGYLSASTEPSPVASAVHTTTLEDLQTHGVDVVNLATDRLIPEADLPQTLNILSQKSIYAVGAGQTQQEARRPQLFEIKGQKVAILGYSDSDLHAAGDRTAGVNPGLRSQIEADIKAIRDQIDWVIVSYHWNKATQADPDESQIALSRAAIDQGADLVVGYAPQIMQGAEIYGGRAIVYSLGNNIDAYSGDKANYDTAALKVTLQDRKMQVEYLPIQVQQNQSAIAQGDSVAKITQYLQQASSLFDHPLRSPLTLDARLRVSLPTAPDAEMPTDPFLDSPSPVKR